MLKLLRWLKTELLKMLPIWLFFFLIFSLLKLTKTVVLHEYDITPSSASLVLIGSLIVAKASVIADKFSFTERFRERPLVYNSAWKTFVYWSASFLFQLVDPFFRLARKRQLDEAVPVILHDIHRPVFWVVQLWLILLLFFFCASRETIRSIGHDQFKRIFWGG